MSISEPNSHSLEVSMSVACRKLIFQLFVVVRNTHGFIAFNKKKSKLCSFNCAILSLDVIYVLYSFFHVGVETGSYYVAHTDLELFN
jgi:hypothetical protein